MKKKLKLVLLLSCFSTIFLIIVGFVIFREKFKFKHSTIVEYGLDRRTIIGGQKVLQFVEVKPGSNSFSCNLSKLWGPDVEAEFIADILYDYKLLSSTMDTLQHSSVLAMSTNKYSVKDIEKAIHIVQPLVLLLLSDEHGNKPKYERLFNKVPLVYRQYRYNSYRNPHNQLILPLGYHCWDTNAVLPSMKKEYIWSFIGSNKGSRAKNLKILDKIKPNFHGSTTFDQNATILNSSLFVFCPIGNSNVECSRQYSASMCGAIPYLLCTNDQWNEIYTYFDIEPPWLHTDDIYTMVTTIQNLLQTPREIEKLQELVLKWWVDMKDSIYKNINNHVLYFSCM